MDDNVQELGDRCEKRDQTNSGQFGEIGRGRGLLLLAWLQRGFDPVCLGVQLSPPLLEPLCWIIGIDCKMPRKARASPTPPPLPDEQPPLPTEQPPLPDEPIPQPADEPIASLGEEEEEEGDGEKKEKQADKEGSAESTGEPSDKVNDATVSSSEDKGKSKATDATDKPQPWQAVWSAEQNG